MKENVVMNNSVMSTKVLAKAIADRINDCKTISGKGIDVVELQSFMNTIEAASNLEVLKSKLTIETADAREVIGLDEYVLDTRLAGFARPRKIMLTSGDERLFKDLRCHYLLDGSNTLMTPGEFDVFQRKLFNQFKGKMGSTVTLDEAVAPVTVTDCDTFINCDETFVAAPSLIEVKKLPVMLRSSEDVFEEDFFDYKISRFIERFVMNLVNEIAG